MAVTKRETLRECLDVMTKMRNAYSHKGQGLFAITRYEMLFREYDEKCQVIREMIQALESEPVRQAMANWQKTVMNRGPEALKLDNEEQLLKAAEQMDIEDYTGNNGALK